MIKNRESPEFIRGECQCYKIQAEHIILRWPEWRNHYRVDMEKVRVRKNQSSKQKKLLPLLVCNMSGEKST